MASSLFDSALLYMVPSGIGVGKVFPIKPLGTNNFDVVRGTIASYVAEDRLVKFAAVNEPRIDWSTGRGMLLVEDAAMNILLHSNDFSNVSAWGSSGTKTSGQLSPTVAGNEGWLITDSSTSAFELILQNVLKPSNTNRVSVFVLKTSGTPSVYPLLGLTYWNGSTVNNNGFYLLNTTNGTGSFRPSVGVLGSPSLTVQDIGLFWRFIFEATDSSGTQPICLAEFYPAVSTDGINISPTVTGSQTIYGFMVGNGSYIPTTSSAATRNADVITTTPPIGTANITTLFEDGSTNVITSIPSTFTVPNGRVQRIIMS